MNKLFAFLITVFTISKCQATSCECFSIRDRFIRHRLCNIIIKSSPLGTIWCIHINAVSTTKNCTKWSQNINRNVNMQGWNKHTRLWSVMCVMCHMKFYVWQELLLLHLKAEIETTKLLFIPIMLMLWHCNTVWFGSTFQPVCVRSLSFTYLLVGNM